MAIVWLSFLHYYTTFTGFLAYLFIGFKKLKLDQIDWFAGLGLLFLILAQLVVKEPVALIIDIRFYWGWFIFYCLFKSTSVSHNMMRNALVILCVLTVIEAVLINTVIPAHVLPNFPNLEMGRSEYVYEGYYQRPYSFGASATVGSSLLVVLMALCQVSGWLFWFASVSVVLFLSGTGLLSLFLLIGVKYPWNMIKALLVLLVAGALVWVFMPEWIQPITKRISDKFGWDYLNAIADLKLLQITTGYESLNPFFLLFGDPYGFRGGDFGFLAFAVSNGILGFFLFLLLVLTRLNRANLFPVLLLVLTSCHYPVMFYLPGQMLFGLVLAMNEKGLPKKATSFDG